MTRENIWKYLVCIVVSMMYSSVSAQEYPIKTIRFIVAGAPGGAADILSRMIAEKLSIKFKQRVIIDNRPGAGGLVGTDIAARSSPDGYTINMGTTGSFAIHVSLQAKMPYDPIQDFSPITMVATAPNVLVVHPSLPAKSVKELIGLAKTSTSPFAFASSGVGFTQHLSGVLFQEMAGLKMTHVSYRGAAEALTDVLAGRVFIMFPNIPTSLHHITSGRLRALGVTTLSRSSALPNVPTIAEAALPGYESSAWYAIFAPAGVPATIVTKLNSEIVGIIQEPSSQKFMHALGANPATSSPAELSTYVKSEIEKWGKVIRAAKIIPQ